MVLLKRLDDAVRDGDRILAVVRGTASNQDGRTVNQSTPSSEAQAAACRTALAVAGVEADTVGLIEAHGTGTPVGDPIEYTGLAQVYGVDGPCAVGSVKTNFGHTMSAAGALGLMKIVLAVEHGVVPPNLHFTGIPDKLAPVKTNLFVPQTVIPWPGKAQGRGGPGCRHMGCRVPMFMRWWNKLRLSSRPRRLRWSPRSGHNLFSRFLRLRRKNCAVPQPDWPIG